MRIAAVKLLDAAFGHPRGLLGRLGAAVMARGNADQERAAVAQARLRPGDRALVVGFGPGLGLELAAGAVVPGGSVVGVDPSPLMGQLAMRRCAGRVAAGVVEIHEGTASATGLTDGSVDAAVSVNNVMLWDRPMGFAELVRVLRPGGRLVLSVHQHVLDQPAEELRAEAAAAGFVDIEVTSRPRRRSSPAIELLARRPG